MGDLDDLVGVCASMVHQGRQGQDVCLVLKGLQGAQVDSARCRAQSPEHAGQQAVEVEGDGAGELGNKQRSRQASKQLGDAQTKPDANSLVEERSGEEWERRKKVDGLVTAVGEMQPGPKMEADSEAAKWLPLPGLRGRWQVAGGLVGRQRSSPWPVGYGPRFLPGSREDGPRNTMRLELSRRPARRQGTEDSEIETCTCLFWRTRARLLLY